MEKYLALDIGNVCIQLDYSSCSQKLGFSDVESFYSVQQIWAKNKLFEEGKLTEEEFLNELGLHSPKNLSRSELKNAWNNIIGCEILGMHEIIQWMLSKNVVPVFFSNTSSIHFAYLQSFLSFFAYVPHAVLSFEEGSSKPEQAIYRAFENRYGKPFFYVDDKFENIEAAREMGWSCYQMGIVTEMKSHLKKLLK